MKNLGTAAGIKTAVKQQFQVSLGYYLHVQSPDETAVLQTAERTCRVAKRNKNLMTNFFCCIIRKLQRFLVV